MNLFYPSHDIALGNGVKHFNPPYAALRLQEDLAALSQIWQRRDDSMHPIPWGWDYDTRSYLNKEFKIKQKELPTDEELETLRQLSSRKTTIDIISKLHSYSEEFRHVSLPVYIDKEEILIDYLANNENFVLKTPWSSSGRGLSISKVISKETMLKHGVATIRKMGGIITERWYEKIQDFAMLFYVGRNDVEFVGYSLFDNDEQGTYRSGKLMSNDMIEASLPATCEIAKTALTDILREIFAPVMNKPWEVGYIGVDMMIVEGTEESQPDFFVHPCVEMNLRCTMGVVARRLFDSNYNEDVTGDFFITPAMDKERLLELDKNLRSTYKDNYRRLTEIGEETMFMAYAIVS